VVVHRAGGAALAVLLAGQLGLLRGTPPDDLGVRDGKLKPPSLTPNSVSSQADAVARPPAAATPRIAPLALRGDGPATIAGWRALCQGDARRHHRQQKPDYLYVQFQTPWLKFVDDAEFWFDPAAGVVQVRSASRIGRKDFGVNRERLESIRSR
jgi:uncharacterized protein (DUF1499 family)